jgi:hypothetical protein
MGGGCGTPLEFIEVNHLQPVGFAWVISRTVRRTHGRTQCQTTDTAHAVDANFHCDSRLIFT